MFYNIFTLSDSKKWMEYFIKLPFEQQDIYFTPEYYKLYENYSDGQAHCFVYQDGESLALYPFLLNSVNELGYNLDAQYFDIQGAYGYNGVIYNDYSESFISKFYSAFNEFCLEKKIIAEFTRFHPLLNNFVFSQNHLNIVLDRHTVHIDLKIPFDILFKNFQKTTKLQIKRAANKYRIELKYFVDSSILDDFLNIYYETMDRTNSVKYLYFNKEYFKNLLELDSSICFIAYDKNKPIAAIIALFNNTYIHGHLGGSLTEYLKIAPFSFLYTEIIKFAQSHDISLFHVGGGRTSSQDDLLFKYKLHFSDKINNFYIGKKIHNLKVYEEVIKQWKERKPECLNNNKILCYRDIL